MESVDKTVQKEEITTPLEAGEAAEKEIDQVDDQNQVSKPINKSISKNHIVSTGKEKEEEEKEED